MIENGSRPGRPSVAGIGPPQGRASGRYGPSWARTRFGYEYSKAFLDRLTPAQRHIMEPVPPVMPGEARIPHEARHNGG